MKSAVTNLFAFACVSMTLVMFQVEEVLARGGEEGVYDYHPEPKAAKSPAASVPKGMAGSSLPKQPTAAGRRGPVGGRRHMVKRMVALGSQPIVLVKRHAHNAGGTPP